jgi:TDG/mug DNA glycosylase family protein
MRTDILLSSGNPFGDLVAPGLRLLIVAINPSTRSEAIGHSFSSPGNPFWRLLHQSGLTPLQLEPSEEHRLLDYGIGLVSTVHRATPSAAALSLSERRAGAARVRCQVEQYEPHLVALLGLTLYPLFFPAGTSRGPGLTSDRIHGAGVHVLPNPSGRNRAYPGFERKLVWYQDLAEHIGPVVGSGRETDQR